MVVTFSAVRLQKVWKLDLEDHRTIRYCRVTVPPAICDTELPLDLFTSPFSSAAPHVWCGTSRREAVRFLKGMLHGVLTEFQHILYVQVVAWVDASLHTCKGACNSLFIPLQCIFLGGNVRSHCMFPCVHGTVSLFGYKETKKTMVQSEY